MPFGDIQGLGVEEVQAMLKEGNVQLVETRPKHFVSRQQDIADGVQWRAPERVQEYLKARPEGFATALRTIAEALNARGDKLRDQLQQGGIEIRAGSMAGLAEALACVDISQRQDFYHTARAFLLHQPGQAGEALGHRDRRGRQARVRE